MCRVVVCCLSVSINLSVFVILGVCVCVRAHVRTWITEEVADHSKTYHCSRGSVVPLVFCSLCPTLLRAGTSVSVVEHINFFILHM